MALVIGGLLVTIIGGVAVAVISRKVNDYLDKQENKDTK